MNHFQSLTFWRSIRARGLMLSALVCLLSASVQAETHVETFSTAGADTFTVPSHVTELTVEVWGAGGSGASGSAPNLGGGGGGGAYSKGTLAVSSGEVYNFVVGAGACGGNCGTPSAPGGDSWFGDATTVMAKGGNSANGTGTGAAGGAASSGVGDVGYSGGNGANRYSYQANCNWWGTCDSYDGGGGGGSSAGTGANGSGGGSPGGGVAPSGGGNGGRGGTHNGAVANGVSPGGGGGGASEDDQATVSGAGADGQIRITYFRPPPDETVYSTPGSDTFTVPASVSEVTVEVWGAGGSGDGGYGGGGGGGAYARSTLAVSPGDVYNVSVGAGACSGCGAGGDSWFGSAATVMAQGGNSTSVRSGASGGAAGSSVGTARYSGGSGTSGSSGLLGLAAYGGGAGSSAGTSGNGNNGSSENGGAAPTGGSRGGHGAGTFLILFGGAGEPGPGPGSGGGGGSTSSGGAGANGQVKLTYRLPELPDLHHFELSHSGAGLTCREESVTIKACIDAACSGTYPSSVSVTLSPTGWVGGDTVAFSGGETTVNFRKTTTGTVSLDAVSSTPAASGSPDTLCRAGGGAASTGSCSLEFYSSALEFDVPDVTAAKLSSDFTISALSTDPATSACVPSFANVSRTVDFWTNHILPAGADLSASPGIAVNGVTVGTSSGTATGVSLSFDGSGQATASVRYSEAGSVELEALYTGSGGTDDTGLSMSGVDGFTSIPAGFCVSADSADAACTGTLSDCSVLAAAGDGFDLTVRAVAWEADGETDTAFCSGNDTTQNFRHGGLGLTHSLVEPSGGNAGSISVSSVPFTNAGAGSQTVSQTVSEVGVFRFSVPVGESYLSRSLSGAASANVGRFTPADFLVAVPDPGELAATCTAGADFAYIGETLDWLVLPDIRITARNRGGATTENYTSTGFRKLVVDDLSRTWPTEDDAEALTDSSGNLPVTHAAGSEDLTVLSPGVMNYEFSPADELTYTKQATAQVGPFTPSVTFDLGSFTDSDAVASVASLPGVAPVANFQLKYGRANLENVSGPENIGALTMPMDIQYWTGDRFQLHTEDSCTTWSLGDLSHTGLHLAPLSLLSLLSSIASSGSGDGLSLVPSGTQGTDTVSWDVSVWLRHDWDGDGVLENPEGLVTFGVYRGHDRVIQWQEQ